jgi:hypothetical protein
MLSITLALAEIEGRRNMTNGKTGMITYRVYGGK